MGVKPGKETWAKLQRGLAISALFSQPILVFERFGAGKWYVYSCDFPLHTIRSCGLDFLLIASSAFWKIKFLRQVTNLSDILLSRTKTSLGWLEGLSNISEILLTCQVHLSTVIEMAEQKVPPWLSCSFALRHIGKPSLLFIASATLPPS